MSYAPKDAYSILRIKRKRDAEPVNALFIEDSETPAKRAKRKETAVTHAGIFRLAATVELASFDDSAETQRLEDRISSLVQSSAARSSPINAAFAKDARQSRARTSSAQARYRIIQGRRQSIDGNIESDEETPDTAVREGYSRGLGRSRPTKTPFARIWDAVEEKYQPAVRPAPRIGAGNDMDAFNEMLAEYLKVSDDAQASSAPNIVEPPSVDAIDTDDESSYVYDVYYRAKTPVASEEVGETYGTLSGLKMSDLVGDLSGESDSERAMTDDEDSNEEDFYRNDYPEGEESSEEEEVVETWGSDENDEF